MSALGLLALISSTLAIHVEQTRNVDTATVAALVDVIGHSVRDRAKVRPTVDNLAWASPCRGESTCIEQIRARTDSDDVLVLSFVGGPTRIRIIAERFFRGEETKELTVDVGRRPARWADEVRAFVAGLVPFEERERPLVVVAPSPAPTSVDPVPWIVAGVGAVALATGIGFGVSSRSSQRRLDGGSVKGQDYLDLRSRASTHAVAANVLIVIGVMSVAAGVIVALVEGLTSIRGDG